MIKIVVLTVSAVLLTSGAASAQTISIKSGVPGTVVTITAPAGTYPAGPRVTIGGNPASNVSLEGRENNQIIKFTVPVIEPNDSYGISVNGVQMGIFSVSPTAEQLSLMAKATPKALSTGSPMCKAYRWNSSKLLDGFWAKDPNIPGRGGVYCQPVN